MPACRECQRDKWLGDNPNFAPRNRQPSRPAILLDDIPVRIQSDLTILRVVRNHLDVD